MDKTASVVILTYKKFEYVYELIDDVLNQDYSQIELIIADDCSPDFPQEKIENYIRANKHDNILNSKVYSNASNLGTVRNLNAAIRNSSGGYVLTMSSDDLFYCNSTVSQIIEHLDKSETGMICCRRVLSDKRMNGIRFMPTKYQISQIERYRTKEEQHRAFATGMYYEMASGSSTFFTRECLFSNGLYDEKYRLLEDWPQFLMLTKKQKLEFAFDLIAVRYRMGGVSSSKSPILISDYIEMLTQELKIENGRYSKIDRTYIEYCISRFVCRNAVVADFKFPLSFARKSIYKVKCLVLERLGLFEYLGFKKKTIKNIVRERNHP